MNDDVPHTNASDGRFSVKPSSVKSPSAKSWKFPLRHPLVAIVGPTASGKSDVAQIVAKRLGGQVLSCDSMQVYRGMDIGTGKVMPDQRIVRHYGLDLVDPGQSYSVAQYQKYARGVIADLDANGIPCVLCGGTGFWARSVIDDYSYDVSNDANASLRDDLQRFAEAHGNEALWSLLNEKDTASAALVHVNDRKRIIRAFELLQEGTSYADNLRRLHHIPQAMPCIVFGLRVDPDVLRSRIDKRVDAMFDRGFVEEVKGLCHQGFRDGLTAPYAIGYRDVVSALDGKISFDEARARMKTETHRYAKRQRTWFRRDSRIIWLDADDFDAETLAQRCLASIGTIEIQHDERG